MQWRDGKQIEIALEHAFNDILASRMRDVPVVNPALSVRAIGFERFGGDWLGVLITPWFMNLLLLPGPECSWIEFPPGSKIERAFPYGSFEFTLADEARLGVYALSSLFSPMFEFRDQDAAVATAEAVLRHLFELDRPTTTTPPRPSISRRDLLRGSFSDKDHQT
ncbi:MAG: [NiFe]-hydrogenase assembly chaperone HybE [Methylococcaceae bacterium]|nr:[NiFe]-hydrogenase assembly chaperone HybE [Methylococcaceae bacterium]